jgi:hypothetical protein
LNLSWFGNLFEAREKIATWWKEYISDRTVVWETGRQKNLHAKSAGEGAVEK